jgi:hypothetical protein
MNKQIYTLLSILLFITNSYAVVLHPEGEPPASWIDRPPCDVIGRWGSNASCVVIDPNWVLTAIHPGGGLTTLVHIDEVPYEIEKIIEHPYRDLRLVKLKDANLRNYVKLYPHMNEFGLPIVAGGYGRGRGSLLMDGEVVYGYRWAGGGNYVLRYGTNIVDWTYDGGLGYEFDWWGEDDMTTYECALAGYDSGGGTFINFCGEWRLAGISISVQTHGKSLFRLPWYPYPLHGDAMGTVRISSVYQWIIDNMASNYIDPARADLNCDCKVNMEDLKIFNNKWLDEGCSANNDYCEGLDFNGDGRVNLKDYAILVANWND